ncbi:ribonuclease H-like [Ambystoma mexicanum]|uniref:ribonuclease H-like n=1 Tax=Ambystoma mexicanum TaxID=8296 RepID=UPI0037E70A52
MPNVLVKYDGIPRVSMGIRPKSSQVEELAAMYKATSTAVENKSKEIVLVTASDYEQNSFIDFLPGWKLRGMVTCNKKPFKHGKLIQAIDNLVSVNENKIHWRQIRGNSRIAGEDKKGNEKAYQLAKVGAVMENPFPFSICLMRSKWMWLTRPKSQGAGDQPVVQWSFDMPNQDFIKE